MSKTLVPIIAIVVVVGGIILLTKDKPASDMPVNTDGTTATSTIPTTPAKATTTKPKTPKPATPAPTTPTDTTPTTPEEETQAPNPNPETLVISIHASDTTANLKVIEANKGDEIRLTFIADPRDNYHGGLEFRSPTMDPVKVMNNQSKMITFTADESFSFTPYWPGTDNAKPYTIDIIVK